MEGLVFNPDLVLVGAFNILKKVVGRITLTLPDLTGVIGGTLPEGLRGPLKAGFNEAPQTSPSLARS